MSPCFGVCWETLWNSTSTPNLTLSTEAETWKEPWVSGVLHSSIWREKTLESWRAFGKILQVLGCFFLLKPVRSDLPFSVWLLHSQRAGWLWEGQRESCSWQVFCFPQKWKFSGPFSCLVFSHLLFQCKTRLLEGMGVILGGTKQCLIPYLWFCICQAPLKDCELPGPELWGEK